MEFIASFEPKTPKNATSALCRLLIVEKHDELRKRLVALVNSQENCQCIGAVVDAESAIAMMQEAQPDLVLMELAVSGDCGFKLLRRLKLEYPDVRRLIFSAHWDLSYVKQAREEGVDGYIFKANPEELIPALRSVIAGQSFFAAGAAIA